MKHLFWVHSSITYYMSRAVIDHLGLKNSDVVFLIARHLQFVPDTFQIVDCNKWLDWYHPFTLNSVFSNKRNIKTIDQTIDKVTGGEEFNLYIPSTATIPCQILITHKKCETYSIIEEGIANYKPYLYNETAVLRSKSVNIFSEIYNLFSKRTKLNHTFLGAYKGRNIVPYYYYFETDAHDRKERHIYLPFYYEKSDDRYNYSDSLIFIMSPLIEYEMIEVQNTEKVFNYVASKLENKKIYVKYHPVQKEDSKQLFQTILERKGIEYEVMNNDIPIEQVLVNSTGVKYFGFESSVLFYATILSKNSEVYSFCDYVSGIDRKFAEEYQKVAPLFAKLKQL